MMESQEKKESRQQLCIAAVQKPLAGAMLLAFTGAWAAMLCISENGLEAVKLCISGAPSFLFLAGLLLSTFLVGRAKRLTLSIALLLPFGLNVLYFIYRMLVAAQQGEFAALSAYAAPAASLAACFMGIAILVSNRTGTRLLACMAAAFALTAQLLRWMDAAPSVTLILESGMTILFVAGVLAAAINTRSIKRLKRVQIKRRLTIADCQLDLARHSLRLFLSFGVWRMIWTYRMTRCFYVGARQGKKAGGTILLYLFVPFYAVYWNYRLAKILDQTKQELGFAGRSALSCLLLTLFGCGGIATILLQDSVNAIAERKLFEDTRLLARASTLLQFGDAPVLIGERCVRKDRSKRTVFGTARLLPIGKRKLLSVRFDIIGKDAAGAEVETQRGVTFADFTEDEQTDGGCQMKFPFSDSTVRSFSIRPVEALYGSGAEWKGGDAVCTVLAAQKHLEADGRSEALVRRYRQALYARCPNCDAVFAPTEYGELLACSCGGIGERSERCPCCDTPLAIQWELYKKDALEEAQQAERERKSVAKEPLRKGFGLGMASVLLLALLVFSLSYALPELKLLQAKQLYDEGEYAKARESFVIMSGYTGSNEYVNACDYATAAALEEQGDTAAAASLFASLNGYKDSAARSSKLDAGAAYDYAVACYRRGAYRDAITALEPLERDAYSDADYLYQLSHLGVIQQLLEQEELQKAMELGESCAKKLYWQPDGELMQMYTQLLSAYLSDKADWSEKLILWDYFDMSDQKGQYSRELFARSELFRDGDLYGLRLTEGRIQPCILQAAEYAKIVLIEGADYAIVSVNGVLMGTMLADGSFRIAPLFSEYRRIDDNYYRISHDGKYGVMSKDGQLVLPQVYDELALLHSYADKRLVWIREGELWGVYDLHKQKVTVTPQFSTLPEAYLYDNNGAVVADGTYALLDGQLVNDEGEAVPLPSTAPTA